MNKQLLLIVVLLFAFINAKAQDFPTGMKYQAVARDNSGNILAEQAINLKITLFSLSETRIKEISYIETHQAITNQLGLFSLTIGRGNLETGIFSDIPWSAGEIWMAVGIDAKGGTNFTSISESKLLAVPYALHALTASDLTGGAAGKFLAGEVWEIGGNLFKPIQEKTIGSIEEEDIFIITSSETRMTVTAFGDIEIANNLDVDGQSTTGTLIAEGDVILNSISGTTNIEGPTTLNGPTTINGVSTFTEEVNIIAPLNVEGDAIIKQSATVHTDFTVGGNVDLNIYGIGVTNIKGETTIDDNLNVNQNVILNELGGTTLVKGETTIDDNFNVNQNVILNELGGTTLVKGETTVDDDFNVNQNVILNELGGTTLVKGETTVDDDFNVNQNVTLNELGGATLVKGETTIENSLEVDGITDLNSALNVNNGSPTSLTGILEVDENATFHEKVLLDNASYSSTSTSTGALVVAGGVGIGKELSVGGAAGFAGTVAFEAPVTISADDESTATNNGALIVAGGVGIAKRINVGGAADFDSNVNVDGVADFNSNISVDGAADFNSNINVDGVADFNSNISVDGAADFNSNVNVDGVADFNSNVSVDGTTTLNNNLTVSKNAGTGGNHVATFENTASGNVMSIKTGAATPTNSNNFITFLNSNNGVVGRIEGESSGSDLGNNQEYQDDLKSNNEGVGLTSTAEGIAIAEEVMSVAKVLAASTSVTGCAGLGACVTSPIPSWIVSAAADAVLQTANLVLQTADLVIVVNARDRYIQTHQDLLGITFASGSEDYAEYLPKLNPEERFQSGDLVGVKNGFITKDTRDADMIMVISFKPIVLGGLPPDEDVSNLEIVAFMGQVSTKIMGKVNPGDYILPSGYNNGFGIGKNPSLMQPEDYKNILGVAWEGHDKMEIGYVNTAIGLNANDLGDIVQVQETKIKQLENQMSALQTILAELVPGYAAAANIKVPATQSHEGHDHGVKEDMSEETSFVQSSENQIVYFPIERNYLEEGFRLAEEVSTKAYERMGKDINTHPFWNKMHNEAGFKDALIDKIGEDLKNTAHVHQSINERILEKN
jgi:hypothetical protein